MSRKSKGIAALIAGALLVLLGAGTPSDGLALVLMAVGVALGSFGLTRVADPFCGTDEFSTGHEHLVHHTTEVCHRR
jgi:membrane-associated phospholipid phosphatase